MSAEPGDSCYLQLGPSQPLSPLVLSVPHAGRDYPHALCALLRVPVGALVALEDRHVDAVANAARRGETMLLARRARAWIDLNRSEQDRDPAVEQGGSPLRLVGRSAKVRSGLGLIPRRAGTASAILARRLTQAEVEARIAQDHRPYHARLEMLLAAARARFGAALLVDLHSMPTLGTSDDPPRIVIGDRFGRSAAGRIVARMEAEARAVGVNVALNAPYAGGHILDRHGDPARGVHAVQVEIDRALYLDEARHGPGPGLAATARLVRAMLDAALDELAPAHRLAAE